MVEVPIFIVNGLIESGKTTLIKEIIENNFSYQASSYSTSPSSQTMSNVDPA